MCAGLRSTNLEPQDCAYIYNWALRMHFRQSKILLSIGLRKCSHVVP